MVAEGDKVVYRYSVSCTHKADFMGMAATGKQLTVTAVVISRIVNGKFQEDWEITDMLGVLLRLGVLPQLAQRPNKWQAPESFRMPQGTTP